MSARDPWSSFTWAPPYNSNLVVPFSSAPSQFGSCRRLGRFIYLLQFGSFMDSDPSPPSQHGGIEVTRKGGVTQRARSRVRSGSKGADYQPGFRREATTVPLTDEEWRMVQEAAKEMPWMLRAGSVTQDGEYRPPGGDANIHGETDPNFVFRTVTVLHFTGCRVGLLPMLNSRMIRVRGKVPYLQWSEDRAALVVPIEMRPWLAEYLDQPKPLTAEAYQYLLKKLSNRLLVKFGVKVHLSPLRIHHTAVQQMARDTKEVAEV